MIQDVIPFYSLIYLQHRPEHALDECFGFADQNSLDNKDYEIVDGKLKFYLNIENSHNICIEQNELDYDSWTLKDNQEIVFEGKLRHLLNFISLEIINSSTSNNTELDLSDLEREIKDNFHHWKYKLLIVNTDESETAHINRECDSKTFKITRKDNEKLWSYEVLGEVVFKGPLSYIVEVVKLDLKNENSILNRNQYGVVVCREKDNGETTYDLNEVSFEGTATSPRILEEFFQQNIQIKCQREYVLINELAGHIMTLGHSPISERSKVTKFRDKCFDLLRSNPVMPVFNSSGENLVKKIMTQFGSFNLKTLDEYAQIVKDLQAPILPETWPRDFEFGIISEEFSDNLLHSISELESNLTIKADEKKSQNGLLRAYTPSELKTMLNNRFTKLCIIEKSNNLLAHYLIDSGTDLISRIPDSVRAELKEKGYLVNNPAWAQVVGIKPTATISMAKNRIDLYKVVQDSMKESARVFGNGSILAQVRVGEQMNTAILSHLRVGWEMLPIIYEKNGHQFQLMRVVL